MATKLRNCLTDAIMLMKYIRHITETAIRRVIRIKSAFNLADVYRSCIVDRHCKHCE